MEARRSWKDGGGGRCGFFEPATRCRRWRGWWVQRSAPCGNGARRSGERATRAWQHGRRPDVRESSRPDNGGVCRNCSPSVRAYGYRNDLWTTRRIGAVIQREFGVEYHPAHVSRILADLGWSCQKPERRALERNEAAIEHWKRHRWVE